MTQTYLTPGRPPQSGYHVTLNTAKPKGYQQLTVSDSAVGLTVPDGANFAVLKVASASLRWRDDDTDPTPSVGMPLDDKDVLSLTHPDSLSNFSAIRSGGSDAVLNVSYYEV